MEEKSNKPDKLAHEVSQARAAGMSYGKWKAMQPAAAVDPNAIPDGWKTCEYCGKPFKPKYNKRFCDLTCREQAYSEKIGQQKSEYMAQYRARKREEKE